MAASRRANRLAREKSPYLLQHAYNPVDWYPWGEEAFAAAKAESKPIFLSIGYATCHWCHVMEKESFEDESTAAALNDTFINIKVDKEELPEVDSMYMELAQVLMSSAGGWPLNVVLTPDLKPFFAVTYMPSKSKRGLMGLQEFAAEIKQLWLGEEKEAVLEQANRLFEIFEKSAAPEGGDLPSKETVRNTADLLLSMADPVFGGFKGEPKFPLSFQASFLLEYGKLHADSRCLFFATNTLDKMHLGGVYDHLGGGFARYSVDDRWIVPHFEKMLYDNALLANTYFEGFKLTKKDSYKKVCEEICSYVLRDMRHPLGGFYSAEDADSEGEEGRFYTWSREQIEKVLLPEEAELFSAVYGVTFEGNFKGRNVLFLPKSYQEAADELGIDLSFLSDTMENAKKKLFAARETRPRPLRDDKIIVAWNALMIDALVKIGSAMGRKEWVGAAVQAAEFIKTYCFLEGRLYRRWREGEARFGAAIDDYAFLIKACLSLFEEGLGEKWLSWAIELSSILETEFKSEKGAFYFSSEREMLVPIRRCEFYDGAEPSGNAVHAENLLRLYQITLDDRYLSLAEDILGGAKNHIETYPPGSCYSVKVLARYLNHNAPTLVVALDSKESLKEEIAREIHSSYSPHLQVVWLPEGNHSLRSMLPFRADKMPIDGQTAAYVCTMKGCASPLLKVKEICKAIQDL